VSERLCTSCGKELAAYGHFVRTASGYRHGACPPAPSEPPAGAPVAAPRKPPTPKPKPPLERFFTCKCMDAKHGSATGCSGTGAEFTSGLCAFCVAECPSLQVQTVPALKSNGVVAPPAVEPAAEPAPEPPEDENGDTGERCIRCGRGLGARGFWVGTAAGRRHSVCPPRGVSR
jgi:hypothetical protein